MSNSVWPHRRQPSRLPRPWDSPGKNTGVGCHFLLQCMKVKSESEVTQSYPTPSDPMDCSPPGPSVHGIFQARVLEWVAIAFSNAHLGDVYFDKISRVVKNCTKPTKMNWWRFQQLLFLCVNQSGKTHKHAHGPEGGVRQKLDSWPLSNSEPLRYP